MKMDKKYKLLDTKEAATEKSLSSTTLELKKTKDDLNATKHQSLKLI
jgi:hypothetical protein